MTNRLHQNKQIPWSSFDTYLRNNENVKYIDDEILRNLQCRSLFFSQGTSRDIDKEK